MGKTVSVTCDGCGNDLTSTSNCVDWRLALVNERLPIASGVATVTSMGVYPATMQDGYFCGVDCLRSWLDKEYPPGKRHHGGKAWAEHQRKERAKAALTSSPLEKGFTGRRE